MKRILSVLALSFVVIGASDIRGQTSQAMETQKLLDLVKAIQAEQAQIDSNQTRINARVADLAETMRVARIEAGRVGGKHLPPPKH
jgi:hypothetical protein